MLKKYNCDLQVFPLNSLKRFDCSSRKMPSREIPAAKHFVFWSSYLLSRTVVAFFSLMTSKTYSRCFSSKRHFVINLSIETCGKSTHESVKTFGGDLRGFSKFLCFHYQRNRNAACV